MLIPQTRGRRQEAIGGSLGRYPAAERKYALLPPLSRVAGEGGLRSKTGEGALSTPTDEPNAYLIEAF